VLLFFLYHQTPPIYLTPLIPLSFKGEGEEFLERGAKPPSLTSTPPSLIKGRGSGG
jgi:hypothetical protein